MGLEENVYPPVLNFPKPASSTHAKGLGLKGLTLIATRRVKQGKTRRVKQGIYEGVNWSHVEAFIGLQENQHLLRL